MAPPEAKQQQHQGARLCYTMCQQFFGGAWSRSKMREGLVKKLSGSLSNELYVCCLPETETENTASETAASPPRRVLVRLYGLSSADPQAVLQDCVLFALLSERGLGPKFYGCFPGGRLEEFIESRCLTTGELGDWRLSQQIARAMASLHRVKMPLCKEPVILRDRLTRWQQESTSTRRGAANVKGGATWQKVLSFDLEGEIRFLLNVLYASNSPVVFCHNDLQEGNILMKDDGSGLVFIDFEYAAYNFRGFDIANHFSERCYNYTSAEPPYFTATLADYPSEDDQVYFIRHYLEALQTPAETMDDEIRSLLEEVGTFALASHMWWALWALMSAKKSRIKFGYLDYAAARLEGYQVFKQRLLERRPDISANRRQESSGDSRMVVIGVCATAADRRNVDVAIGPDVNCGTI